MAITNSLPALILGLAVATYAATYQVGPGQTYTTIQACLDVVAPGDTCNVHAGTYTEQCTLRISGTPGHAITIRRNSSDTVVVQSSMKPVLEVYGNSYWTIDGINMTYDGNESGDAIGFTVNNTTGRNIDYITVRNGYYLVKDGGANFSGVGFQLQNCANCLVENNTFEVAPYTTLTDESVSMLGMGFAQHLVVRGNAVFGAASATTNRMLDGIIVDGTDILVEDNIVHDGWAPNHPDGIVVQAYSSEGDVTSNVRIIRNTVWNFTSGIYLYNVNTNIVGTNLVANNLVYELPEYRYIGEANKMNGIGVDGGYDSLETNHKISVDIYNNTIASKQARLFVLRTDSGSSIDIKNNIFIEPGYGGVVMSTNPGVTMDYNYYTYASLDDIAIIWGHNPDNSNIAYTLADFISATGNETHSRVMSTQALNLNADFTESSLSDSRARGLNLSNLFTKDRVGAIRPSGFDPWDIGAFQYTGNPGIRSQPPNSSKHSFVYASYSKLSFLKNTGAEIFDLKGRKIGIGQMKGNGIYFVRSARDMNIRKHLSID